MGGLLREFLDVAAEAGESGPLGAPPETTAATRHVLAAQQTLSALPRRGELPAEILRRRGRAHLFLYPFEGRPVHEGLAALLARRMHKLAEGSLAVSTNDYGLQMESDADYPFEELLHKDALFSPAGAEADAADTANIDELARRRFRGIARVSGLIFPGYPGSQKSTRRLQASAGLLYDVFAEHEPDNLLLTQARREVLRDNLNTERLSSVLERLSGARRVVVTLEKPSPLAFPLLVEQLSQQSSSLSMQERVERLRRQYDLAGTA
jgi:ATP-dependent Lhr-like helicase